ncbi:uncharacterized protein LOC110676642 [Aedes aegypti]|uniref:Uncharacterized protein n=1 Tax=Aedes aegypti TaxID=7159 RepID=A0A6I8U1A4_AEDAE|nr:uncharacterized protein LOC110676642 [Aedes aegypti]
MEQPSISSATGSNISDVVVQDPDRNGSIQKESYSLVIVLKSLVLANVENDDPRTLDISLLLGETEAKLNGTLADFNGQRHGTAISVPTSNSEEFKRYLTSHELLITIGTDLEVLGQTNIPLAATNLASFDPPAFEPIIINDAFPIIHESQPIGKIDLALKTDRTKSPPKPDGPKDGPEEEDSMLYIVNDASPRQSNEFQDDIMRQLLTCKKCNALRSPSEMSYQYELIDGILVNKEYPRKDPDLETMKRKIEQIEWEAKLYPVGKEQPPPKEPAHHRFCDGCGGYSITGATCTNRMQAVDVPLSEAQFRYPEGSAKRFSTIAAMGMSENVARISEPNFSSSRATETRFTHDRSESLPLHPIQQRTTSILCPKSVGHRFCNHCGLNMDWLPLHSGCPKCGFKNPATCHNDAPSTLHETTPNRLNSWMGSLELPEPQLQRPSTGTLRSTSLNEMMKPCPICRLRGGCCPDCKKRASTAQNHRDPNSTTQSSTSDSEMHPRRVMERPKTRPSLRDRFNIFPKKIDKATRLSDLYKAYGDKDTNPHEVSQRRSTKSSIVSLNVEEILKKTDTHKRKITSGGIQSVELRKVQSSREADRNNKTVEKCDSPTHAQIRKNQRSLLQRIKKQNRGKYSYRYGQRYPGIVIGHRECIQQGRQVPPHMGWMWNVKTLGINKIRKGWRPGAVKKPIKELMQHFLVSYPLDNIPVSKKTGRNLKIPADGSEHTKQKPTLQIVKKNGEYCIVMNPLKDSASLKTAQDPYLNCEPIRFKLAKDPNVGKLYQLRSALKVKGFTMCGCSELESCEHKSEKEKKLLRKELRKLAKCLGLPKSTELKDVPIDSESELDLEFTPPSAMLKSGQRKPDVVCTETQYSVDDYKVQVPADKLKCKPGREDPNDVGKGLKGKGGQVRDKAGKDGKGGKGGKDGKGQGKGGAGSGVGAGAGGKAKTGPSSKAGVGGAKAGAAGTTNKSQNIHRPEGGQVLIMKDLCRRPDVCAPSQICPPVAAVCAYQPSNVCYPTQCAPTACYNPCYI